MEWILFGGLLFIGWSVGSLVYLQRHHARTRRYIWGPWNRATAAHDWTACERYARRADQARRDISLNPWVWWTRWNTTWEDIP